MADKYDNRVIVIGGLFVGVIAILIGMALNIQVLNSKYAAKRDMGMGQLIKYPARGLIYDREGKLLVVNEPIYDLMVTYAQVEWDHFDTTRFCQLLHITEEQFKANIEKDWDDPRYNRNSPFPFLTKLSTRQFMGFQEFLHHFPGFYAQLRHARVYNYPHAAHVLGYIGETDQRTLADSIAPNGRPIYQLGDYVGVSGLEKTYEAYLRGEKGYEMVFKDNMGRVYGSMQKGNEAVGGHNLIATIDIDLQAYGEQLMQSKIGSIVAIEPSTGEILAMVSTPTYDPNRLIIGQERSFAFQELLQDSLKPFLDRSVSATYPPGSPFKTIVSLIGLEEGTLRPNRTVPCFGGYALGGKVLTACHAHPTCTSVSMAIQHSCNAYFVTAFREIVDQFGTATSPTKGLNRFNEYLYQFGLGSSLDTDVPSEQAGNVATSDYYGNVYKKEAKWSSAWIRSLGIGQGELLMTNLQLANVAAAIANRGEYYTPHLVKGIFTDENDIQPYRANIVKTEIKIAPQHFEPVINGMELVTLAGTARLAAIPGIPVCGKTGTAENSQRGGQDHSVFFAFAPKENPQIAIAVYVENGGWGGSYAAPIASLMIEQYINDSIGPARQWLEQRMFDTDLINLP